MDIGHKRNNIYILEPIPLIFITFSPWAAWPSSLNRGARVCIYFLFCYMSKNNNHV